MAFSLSNLTIGLNDGESPRDKDRLKYVMTDAPSTQAYENTASCSTPLSPSDCKHQTLKVLLKIPQVKWELFKITSKLIKFDIPEIKMCTILVYCLHNEHPSPREQKHDLLSVLIDVLYAKDKYAPETIRSNLAKIIIVKYPYLE